MTRIFYLIPDLYGMNLDIIQMLRVLKKGKGVRGLSEQVFPKHKAVGGVKVMYQHCIMLKELGFDAVPVLMGNYEGNFFDYDINVVKKKEIQATITSQDIVVSTEFCPYDAFEFPSATKVLFMQNWLNITRRLADVDKGKSYHDLGYDYVMTCGDFCTQKVYEEMAIEATTITNGIDQVKFRQNPSVRVENRVLVLSRKNYSDFEKIRELSGKSIDFQIVDGLTQQQLIEEYQKADIFLATGYPEGFGLPPLEAMLCGCVVVGFTGGGAREYMRDLDTALVADDGDCQTASEKLMRVLQDPILKEKIRVNGSELASTYTLMKTKDLLNEFFSQFTH